MVKRKIVTIDEQKCTGCGQCIPGCPEGALQIIDGKARLVSDLFCDGLGACIGECPVDAITVEEREAEPYSEVKVMENIVKAGHNTIKAHLEHLKGHGETAYYNQAVAYLKDHDIKVPSLDTHPSHAGCPGTRVQALQKNTQQGLPDDISSELGQWPIQLNLLPIQAPFFSGADLLIAADCAGFAHPMFHSKILKGKVLAIGCPKLDDIDHYEEKITEIFKNNDISTITVAIMEVPCCSGLLSIVENAVDKSGKELPLKSIVLGINGKPKG